MTKRQVSLDISMGMLLTAIAIGLNKLAMGRAINGLDFGLFVALIAWLLSYPDSRPIRPRVFPLFLAAIVVQIIHFLEEYATGFYNVFPDQFGVSWTASQFVAFNIAWLVVLVIAAVGVRKNVRLALLAVWFQALVGGIGNGLLHGYLCYQDGGYYPGSLSTVLSFPLGIALVIVLIRKARVPKEIEKK